MTVNKRTRTLNLKQLHGIYYVTNTCAFSTMSNVCFVTLFPPGTRQFVYGRHFTLVLLTEKCYELRPKPRCRPLTPPTLGQKSTVWGNVFVRWRAKCHVLAPGRCPRRWQANIEPRWQRHRSERLRKRGDYCCVDLQDNIIILLYFILYDNTKGLPQFCCNIPNWMTHYTRRQITLHSAVNPAWTTSVWAVNSMGHFVHVWTIITTICSLHLSQCQLRAEYWIVNIQIKPTFACVDIVTRLLFLLHVNQENPKKTQSFTMRVHHM